VLINEHGFSRSTLARLIADLRDRLGAPLIHDSERGGYRYDTADGSHALAPACGLPPRNCTPSSPLKHLLANLEPGLLDDPPAAAANPHRQAAGQQPPGRRRGRPTHPHPAPPRARKTSATFQTVTGAVLQRSRLKIDYYNRERDQIGTREISPQRLAHYRDNWYLDAWCHGKKGLRIFAVECIRAAAPLGKAPKPSPNPLSTANSPAPTASSPACPSPPPSCDSPPNAPAGSPTKSGIHNSKVAGWKTAATKLRLPYSDERELLMDILKYGLLTSKLWDRKICARSSKNCWGRLRASIGDEKGEAQVLGLGVDSMKTLKTD